jgi:branched-chain amino acid transport system permease protein
MVAQQLLNGFVTGSVYALFALGFNLIFGVHRIMNLAHGALLMLGAFIALYAVQIGIPLWTAFVLAMAVSGAMAVALDFVAFRPLRRQRSSDSAFAAIVASIGAAMILTNIAQRISGAKVMRFPFGTVPVEAVTLFGLRLTPLQIVVVVSVWILVGILAYYLYATSFGRQVRAVANNERAAMLLGVEPRTVYVQTFFLSGAFAGAAGVLVGLSFNAIHFGMGEPYLLLGFVVLVVGGLGSLTGAVCAGILLGVTQTLTIAYLPTGLGDIIVYLLLFVVLLVRPNGLFGQRIAASRIGRR